MTTPSIVILILLSYGTAMLLISRRASRRIRSFQDTIAAPGQTSLFLLAGSAIGGQIGSGFVIGGAEYGARYGIAGAWYGIGCGLSYFITAALCRFIRTHHYVSPADYFARRYSGHATRMIYTAASISCSVSLLAGQLLAGRTIFLTLGLPAQWGVVLTAVIALVYSNAAGLWGSMAVSSIQSVIIFIGMSTALFLMMSDTDGSFNFLISMIYTQLFNLLCEKADDVYGGRLPVHVRCLIDEAANIGQIPNLEKLVATIRSREISACLVLQARSQLKAIYKDNADTIIGNMDSQVFLGGSEPTTLKELSEALGKETIDTFNTSDTRGSSPSCGTNYQKLGKELMSRDELAVMEAAGVFFSCAVSALSCQRNTI